MDNVTYHGTIRYSDYFEEEHGFKFIVSSKKELDDAIHLLKLTDVHVSKLLDEINLDENNIVLLYYGTNGSNNYGIKNINYFGFDVIITVVEFRNPTPGMMSSCAMDGTVLVLSYPKRLNNYIHLFVKIDKDYEILKESEFKDVKYETLDPEDGPMIIDEPENIDLVKNGYKIVSERLRCKLF